VSTRILQEIERLDHVYDVKDSPTNNTIDVKKYDYARNMISPDSESQIFMGEQMTGGGMSSIPRLTKGSAIEQE
jgi:hypothetical protein